MENLFAQHNIGKDKIDQAKESKEKNYVVGKDLKAVTMISGVLIGSDKVFEGEIVTLTFLYREQNVSGDGFDLTKGDKAHSFALKCNEIKKIFLILMNDNPELDRINLGIGKRIHFQLLSPKPYSLEWQLFRFL
jgi:hypothetical protein